MIRSVSPCSVKCTKYFFRHVYLVGILFSSTVYKLLFTALEQVLLTLSNKKRKTAKYHA